MNVRFAFPPNSDGSPFLIVEPSNDQERFILEQIGKHSTHGLSMGRTYTSAASGFYMSSVTLCPRTEVKTLGTESAAPSDDTGEHKAVGGKT